MPFGPNKKCHVTENNVTLQNITDCPRARRFVFVIILIFLPYIYRICHLPYFCHYSAFFWTRKSPNRPFQPRDPWCVVHESRFAYNLIPASLARAQKLRSYPFHSPVSNPKVVSQKLYIYRSIASSMAPISLFIFLRVASLKLIFNSGCLSISLSNTFL